MPDIFEDILHLDHLIREGKTMSVAVYMNTLSFDLSELSVTELHGLKIDCERDNISKEILDLINEVIRIKS